MNVLRLSLAVVDRHGLLTSAQRQNLLWGDSIPWQSKTCWLEVERDNSLTVCFRTHNCPFSPTCPSGT